MASKTLKPMDLRLAYMLYHVLLVCFIIKFYIWSVCFFCNFPEPKVVDPEVGSATNEKNDMFRGIRWRGSRTEISPNGLAFC